MYSGYSFFFGGFYKKKKASSATCTNEIDISYNLYFCLCTVITTTAVTCYETKSSLVVNFLFFNHKIK